MAGSGIIPSSFVSPSFWSKWAKKFANIKSYDNKSMQTVDAGVVTSEVRSNAGMIIVVSPKLDY